MRQLILQSAPQDSSTPPSMDVAKSKGKVETIKHDRKTLRSKAAPPSQETPHASDWNGLLAQTALKDLVPPVPPCCWSISQHPRLTCLICFMNLHTICTLCMHMMFALCFKMHLRKFVFFLWSSSHCQNLSHLDYCGKNPMINRPQVVNTWNGWNKQSPFSF